MPDIRNRLGMHQYTDCHADCLEDESVLTCSTWAHHVALNIESLVVPTDSARNTGMANIGLDRAAVKKLVAQLNEWLDK